MHDCVLNGAAEALERSGSRPRVHLEKRKGRTGGTAAGGGVVEVVLTAATEGKLYQSLENVPELTGVPAVNKPQGEAADGGDGGQTKALVFR